MKDNFLSTKLLKKELAGFYLSIIIIKKFSVKYV